MMLLLGLQPSLIEITTVIINKGGGEETTDNSRQWSITTDSHRTPEILSLKMVLSVRMVLTKMTRTTQIFLTVMLLLNDGARTKHRMYQGPQEGGVGVGSNVTKAVMAHTTMVLRFNKTKTGSVNNEPMTIIINKVDKVVVLKTLLAKLKMSQGHHRSKQTGEIGGLLN